MSRRNLAGFRVRPLHSALKHRDPHSTQLVGCISFSGLSPNSLASADLFSPSTVCRVSVRTPIGVSDGPNLPEPMPNVLNLPIHCGPERLLAGIRSDTREGRAARVSGSQVSIDRL